MEEETLLAWLEKTFLASALQGEDEGQVTVIKFSVSPAVAAGTNYMSHLYRVRVEYTVDGSDKKSTSLIIKIPMTKGALTEVMDSSEFYAKEPRIYRELLPRFNKMVNCEFAPKFYSCPIENGIILKDMTEEGYIMCDKFKQLDFSHSELVFTSLAKFHASSVAFYHNNPELVKELGKDELHSFKSDLIEPYPKSALKYLGKVLGGKEGHEEATQLILSRTEYVTDSVLSLCVPKTNGLNVLNHGDLWVNNMLFKHSDSGEVVDVKLIDFQVLRWGSPASDLHYFLWSSVNEDVREYRQQELLSLYRQTLNTSLEQLGCAERLSERELDDDLRAASDYILFIISGALPFMLSGSDDAVNLEDLTIENFKTTDLFEHLYNNKRFQKILPKLVRQYQEWVGSYL